ncbi:B12-binding domain-containing radical SAM protein [Parahaliea mediterranea]|uniref:B12-binding domain-containing radical SAM protein n=1 Tax=Parahaliea mediterranea TaxID=651086 RepID=UPI000E2EB356|nr:radical SAM protein [Parahaliea mediterranea]
MGQRKKVLIVNVFFPDERMAIKRSNQVPNAVAPALLGGYFNADTCEVRLYNEVNSGFLEVFEPALLGWPDLLVLTGLTAAFDRLLHLTAYAKTANPGVIVAAGGHGVRALPTYSRAFFDYTCLGDVDEIAEVAREALGPEYVARVFQPRYDLAYWIHRLGYAESSRNCNFKCGFCSLTGVGRKYEVPPMDYLDAQMDALGKRPIFFFQDNQIMGSGPDSFRERVQRFDQRRRAGQFKYWSGFVTDTFFWEDANIDFARDTGCISVFVGVESFDDEQWLGEQNKKQNSRYNQADLLRRACDGGVLVQYGLVYDPTRHSLAQMRKELAIICDNPEIPPPNFIFTAIPFPGTPFFRDSLEQGLLLPNTHMRHMEGSTLSLKPTLDPQPEVVDFIRSGRRFAGFRGRFLRHQAKFLKRYRHSLNRDQMLLSSIATAAIMAPTAVLGPGAILRRKVQRTHVSTTEVLDSVYTPRLPVAEAYRHYFLPTNLVDWGGEVNPALADDVLPPPQQQVTADVVQLR